MLHVERPYSLRVGKATENKLIKELLEKETGNKRSENDLSLSSIDREQWWTLFSIVAMTQLGKSPIPVCNRNSWLSLMRYTIPRSTPKRKISEFCLNLQRDEKSWQGCSPYPSGKRRDPLARISLKLEGVIM